MLKELVPRKQRLGRWGQSKVDLMSAFWPMVLKNYFSRIENKKYRALFE
jgi:hypothetical protein